MSRFMTHGDSETYRGYTIRVVDDCTPMNPQTDWDCMTPMLIDHGRGWERDYSDSDDLRDPFAYITPWQCSRHFRQLCDIIGIDPDQSDSDCRDYAEPYVSLSDCRHDYLADQLHDQFQGCYNKADEYAALAELWRFAGCAAIDSSISGFSQGDYADVLAVQTPKWREKVGAPKPGSRSIERETQDLECDVEIYGSYAFGAVYGFVIEDSEGEEIDSCFGFYGMDTEKSGLWSEATYVVDCEISFRRKRKIERLKEMIRNRVPLAVRWNEI